MILRDPVHGLISFEADEFAIVPRLMQADEVQRLRRIRQLGLTSLAYPGADHTRFSHAIGAAHVMTRFIGRLRQIDGDLPVHQRVTAEQATVAVAAAFLHDLGHGPLSHLFEMTCGLLFPLDAGAAIHYIPSRRGPDIIRVLNEIRYDGPLSVEWEDCGMDREYGAADAAQFLARLDFAPSSRQFDDAFGDS